MNDKRYYCEIELADDGGQPYDTILDIAQDAFGGEQTLLASIEFKEMGPNEFPLFHVGFFSEADRLSFISSYTDSGEDPKIFFVNK